MKKYLCVPFLKRNCVPGHKSWLIGILGDKSKWHTEICDIIALINQRICSRNDATTVDKQGITDNYGYWDEMSVGYDNLLEIHI